MKKLLYVSTLFFFILFLSSCDGINTELTDTQENNTASTEATTEVYFDETIVLSEIESMWDDYLINTYINEKHNIDDVNRVMIIGYYVHFDHIFIDMQIDDYFLLDISIIVEF